MNIAVFADVHGRVALCFDLCAKWQETTGERIDLILQAGDLGAFPDLAHLDSATKKHAERDATELGFAEKFAVYRPEIADLLKKTDAPLIFVRGNHEDHAWLDSLEQPAPDAIFAVDVYQRVFCLKTGIPYRFERGDEHITIAGIGRVGTGSRPNAAKAAHIQDYEIRRLNKGLYKDVDVLVTHDIPYGYLGDDSGMEESRLFLDANRPAYHFFGHLGGDMMQDIDDNGYTMRVKLADLHWNKRTTQLEAESFGILRWHNREVHTFEVVDEVWLDRYNKHTWKYA